MLQSPLQRLIEPECSRASSTPRSGHTGHPWQDEKEDELTEQQLGMETRQLKIGNSGGILP